LQNPEISLFAAVYLYPRGGIIVKTDVLYQILRNKMKKYPLSLHELICVIAISLTPVLIMCKIVFWYMAIGFLEAIMRGDITLL